MAFSVFRTIQAPTVVRCVVAARLIKPSVLNLAVGRGDWLQIYALSHEGGEDETAAVDSLGGVGGSGGEAAVAGATQSLILVAEFQLYGTIESMVACKFPNQVGESLLLSFKGSLACRRVSMRGWVGFLIGVLVGVWRWTRAQLKGQSPWSLVCNLLFASCFVTRGRRPGLGGGAGGVDPRAQDAVAAFL